MAAKRSSVIAETKQIEVPKDIRECTFWKRVPYKLDEEQWKFIESIWNKNNLIVFCDAKAGTSKTTLSVGMGLLMYELGLYKKLYYIVSPCQEQELGYRPGDLESKLSAYRTPLDDALITWGYEPDKVVVSADNMDNVKNGNAFVTITSDVFLRGCNFSEAFVIIDEAQNSKQLKKIISRCHDTCKVLRVGHRKQTDLRHSQDSQFPEYIEAARKVDFAEIVELTINHRGKLSTWADNVD